jgi:hypothetical protein
VTKKKRKYAFIGLMVPGIILGAGWASALGLTSLLEFFSRPSNLTLLGAALGNLLVAFLCVAAPLWLFARAESGGKKRRERRILTGVAVGLAYLLPFVYLGIMLRSI